MTALILVVDDVPANVKLLEAKLANEYYDVVSAENGLDAIELAKEHKPDLVLLDVMMPGIDGFETCKRMKQDVEIAHIPVVMVTALSEAEDRVRGLDAGADDFLTKPINDVALFARVKSLLRIKMLLDELRLRDQTRVQMGLGEEEESILTSEVTGARVLLIEDDAVQAKRIKEHMVGKFDIEVVTEPESCFNVAANGDFDLFIISTLLSDTDGLRLASQLKSQEMTRYIPILIMVDEDDDRAMLKGLEMGINDYIITPVDYSEMSARMRTQVRRKRYQDVLRSSYQQSMSMAVTDSLTGLYNRHYLGTHLENMTSEALATNKPLALMMMDMDHFKEVNDTYGHDVGDQVLKDLSNIIIQSIRSSDLAARYGGEEFVVLMPGTDVPPAKMVADRLRKNVEEYIFKVSHEVGQINKTISIGVSYLNPMGDTGENLLKRADEALYQAKHNGRNLVVIAKNV